MTQADTIPGCAPEMVAQYDDLLRVMVIKGREKLAVGSGEVCQRAADTDMSCTLQIVQRGRAMAVSRLAASACNRRQRQAETDRDRCRCTAGPLPTAVVSRQ